MLVALAFDAHDVAVVYQPVHSCHAHRSTWVNLPPLPERPCGGHQQGFALVALADQLAAAYVVVVIDYQPQSGAPVSARR